MIRKLSLLLAGTVMGASVMSLTYGSANYLFNRQAIAASVDTYKQLNIFGDIFARVRAQYVTEPSDEELVKNAIDGMLLSLDPHSSYLTSTEYSDMRDQTRGKFGGVGIQITPEEGKLIKVVSPIDGTPAARAGILSGDLIIKIDGTDVRELGFTGSVHKMRGPVDALVVLTIQRKGDEEPFDVTIRRAIIRQNPVEHSIERDTIGYLRISNFNELTLDGLTEAIKKISHEVGVEKIEGYILDLRSNPGGLLDQAISISDVFLERGEIVSTRGRNQGETRRYTARPGDNTSGKPVIILVDGGSASASEIVAGALQDHKRATIIGSRSFGKGSVQTIIPLGSDSGALRLTTALYYTPSGRSIQAKGIFPDIPISQNVPEELKEYTEFRSEAQLSGHIISPQENDSDSGSISYRPKNKEEDQQLNYALDLLLGIEKHDAFPPNLN